MVLYNNLSSAVGRKYRIANTSGAMNIAFNEPCTSRVPNRLGPSLLKMINMGRTPYYTPNFPNQFLTAFEKGNTFATAADDRAKET